MRNLPVHWHEGLLLRPQHFQTADRYWTEQFQTSDRWDHPYNYGIHKIVINREALADQRVELVRLQARMLDGTLIDISCGQAPDRLEIGESLHGTVTPADLSDAFEKSATVRVFLGVPRAMLGRANVARGENVSKTRYTDVSANIHDESWGSDDEEIQFRRLNFKLLLSTQDRSGYELLPLIQVKRAPQSQTGGLLDDTYIPPLLRLDAWDGLEKDVVRAIYDAVCLKIEVLSRQIAARGIGLESNSPGDVDRILMLSVLNSAYTTLGMLAFAKGVHPREAYAELCRIAGQLLIFGPDRRSTATLSYDHDELYRVFLDVTLRIETLLNSVRDYEYEKRYFVGDRLGMQVSIEPRWFNSDWQWYIGVNKGDLSSHECQDLLTQLDWKLGSSRQVELLFKHRAAGVQLTPVERAVGALPVLNDWMYFEVRRQDSPAWQDVQQTQTLAMRLKDSLIVNLDKLEGEQNLVVAAYGRQVPLKFALFAVPQKA